MRIMLNVVLAGMLQIALAGALSAGEVVRVTINDLAFAPSDAHAEPGDTIEWVNEDFLDHTATETSDVDLVIVADASQLFLRDLRWAETFGRIASLRRGGLRQGRVAARSLRTRARS